MLCIPNRLNNRPGESILSTISTRELRGEVADARGGETGCGGGPTAQKRAYDDLNPRMARSFFACAISWWQARCKVSSEVEDERVHAKEGNTGGKVRNPDIITRVQRKHMFYYSLPIPAVYSSRQRLQKY